MRPSVFGLQVAQGENIVQTRVEPFDEQVGAHAPETAVEVGRAAEAVRPLLAQPLRQTDADPLSADDGDVHILVEGLRSAVSSGIAHPQVHRLRGVETHVDPGAENRPFHQVVLVQASAEQQRPTPVLPLVLEIESPDVHRLLGAHIVSERKVLQVVVVVFDPERQFRRHEQQPPEGMDVLHARGKRQVVRRTVGRRVLLAAVVALAGRILERGIGIQAVAAVRRREVERKAAAVDGMVHLFGDQDFVGRAIELIASAAVFGDVVVLRRDARIGPRAEIGAHADRAAADHGQLRESVAVVVVARAVATLSEDAETRPATFGDQRSVEHRIVVVGAAAPE